MDSMHIGQAEPIAYFWGSGFLKPGTRFSTERCRIKVNYVKGFLFYLFFFFLNEALTHVRLHPINTIKPRKKKKKKKVTHPFKYKYILLKYKVYSEESDTGNNSGVAGSALACVDLIRNLGSDSTRTASGPIFIKPLRIKVIAHWVWNFRMRFSVFSYSPSFPIKMHATDAETQKIEPDPNIFWRTKVSEAVCKRDWHNVRSYLFFNMRKFQMKISDSVCNDLYSQEHC